MLPTAQPKPRPRALDRAEKKAERERLDKAESAKAKARARGRCEVYEWMEGTQMYVRCPRIDRETHHLIWGIGRRGRGPSAEAANKIRCCTRCHEDITRHILVPVDATQDATGIRYRRVQ